MSQVSIDHRDLALLLELVADVVEDIAPAERRVLDRVAGRLDKHRNWMVTGGQNSRVARPVVVVPCTYTDHHLSGRAAGRAGVEPCRCAGDTVVPDFTDEAKAEPLTDQHGWSRARVMLDP